LKIISSKKSEQKVTELKRLQTHKSPQDICDDEYKRSTILLKIKNLIINLTSYVIDIIYSDEHYYL